MREHALQQLYQDFVVGRSSRQRTGCPPAASLLELVERRGSEESRLATLDHVMACSECRKEFELLRAVNAAGVETRVVAATPARWRSALLRPPLLAAAAVTLLLAAGLVGRLLMGPPPDVMRGAPSALVLVSPTGGVSAEAPVRLIWRSVATADRYDVEVLDENGSLAFKLATTDTSLVVPITALRADASYSWWVGAVLPDGRDVRSGVGRFRLIRP